MSSSGWKEAVKLGLVLCVFFLTLTHAAIEWVNQPQNTAVAKGDNLILACKGRLINETNPSFVLSYKWELNNTSLPSKASRFSNNSLFVPDVSEEDLGEYICTISKINRGGDGGLTGTVVESVSSSAEVIEAYLEPFLMNPTSVEASVGEKIVFTCVTGRSSPSVQVQWLRNGETFTQGEEITAAFGDYDETGLSVQISMRLTLTVSHDVFGTFECAAFNSMLQQGVRSQEANLTNKITPSNDLPIIQWDLPEKLIVSSGHALVLSCKSTELTEPVVIEWYLGQYRVDESKRVYILQNRSLAFIPVDVRDSGNYSCVASNSKGRSRSPTLDLTVAYLNMDFFIEPSNTFAIYGAEVVLRCDPPNSIPRATVTWYKDYSVLDLQPERISVVNNDLYIMPVEKADKGVYYCVAFNNFTSPSSRTSKIAKLTVEGPPIMVLPPINTDVTKGKLLQLTCLVDSDPLPIISWKFEGRALAVDKTVSLINRGQNLSITNVGKAWEGRYTCSADNKYGSVSSDAYVTVLVPPVSIRPIGQIVAEGGDSLLIPCHVVSDPMPQIHWLYNGVEIFSSRSHAALPPMNWSLIYPDLYIEHVSAKHAGNYTCVGTNEGGKASSSGTLIVNILPSFMNPPENQTAVIGGNVTLTCEGEGHPVPSVHWLFNASADLPKNSQLTDSNKTLILIALSWNSIGNYTCVIENVVGHAQTTASVKMIIPPKIEEIIYPESPVKVQSKFTLLCKTSGIPTPTVQWILFDQPIQPSLNGRVRLPREGVLEIEFAQQNDTGLYKCLADSVAGQDKQTVSVVVYGRPSPPVLVSAIPISPDSVYLFWQWSDNGDASQRMDTFHIYYREKSSENKELYPEEFPKNITRTEVLGLKPGTSYVFQVVAVNDVGESEPSNLMSTVTRQSGPSAPANLQTTSVTVNSVNLTWEVPTSSNGVIRMYQLRYKSNRSSEPDFTYKNITDPSFPTQDIFLSPLRPYTFYYAQVRAANIEDGQYLWGDYSTMLTFHTLMTTPSLPPLFIKANAIDPYSITVTWQPIPSLAQNGRILLYHLVYSNNDSQLLGSRVINDSISTYTINGLSPWRLYFVTLRGENAAGFGPSSDPVGVRTFPVAPVVPPSNFQVVATSDSSLTLSWEPIPIEKRTCEVTSYIVEHREKGSSTWLRTEVPTNSSHSYIIESLQSWTWHETRVASHTSTVTPGLGPFSYIADVRTLQGESSYVTSISFSTNETAILLSWQQPEDVKGVLIGYRVKFYQMNATDDSRSEVLHLSISETSVTLENLEADALYNINISAVNEAGPGKNLVLRVRTAPYPELTPTASYLAMTSDTYNFTGNSLGQSDAGHIKKNLASIVAGSIVGGIAFIIITAFICIKCMKYRQKQRLSYVVGTDSVIVNADSTFRPIDNDLSPQVISTITSAPSDKSYDVTDSPAQSSSTQSPYHPSALEKGSNYNGDESGNNNNSAHFKKDKKEQKSRSPRRLSMPRLSVPSNYCKLDDDEDEGEDSTSKTGGIDNPGFQAVSVPSLVPESSQAKSYGARLSVFNDDTISVTSETLKRRSRMRSESAAAIAVMRNSSQVVNQIDTDTLVDNEISSEVIFNERTVL